jgi:nucleotide-binding universal stress UspA family protein
MNENMKILIAYGGSECADAALGRSFPGWNIRHEILADSPAWAIIRTADQWKPDLVVVGAQGHSICFLGKVPQRPAKKSQGAVLAVVYT